MVDGRAPARPLIGLTAHPIRQSTQSGVIAAFEAYVAAVVAAGGAPVVVPPTADVHLIADTLDRLDGVVFTGGKDVDPAHYGERLLNDTVLPEPDRDAFELPLARRAVEQDVPVLAICRGCQVLNVALGGSLWQDLPAQQPEALLHAQRAGEEPVTHAVTVAAGSLVERSLGNFEAPLLTNTFHHQAARLVPPALTAVACSTDGVIEAIEAPGKRFVVGVQWHPERLALVQREHYELFAAFVAAARARRLGAPSVDSLLGSVARSG